MLFALFGWPVNPSELEQPRLADNTKVREFFWWESAILVFYIAEFSARLALHHEDSTELLVLSHLHISTGSMLGSVDWPMPASLDLLG